jgi:type I restriction enzyme M protein
MASNQNQNSSTITGDVKSRIDKIWDTLWAGGITVPVTILEQLTYLFFIKLLDDKQRREESNAIEFGYELEDPLFKKGEKWTNPETVYDDPKDVFARIDALEAQFAAKQQEFKQKYL